MSARNPPAPVRTKFPPRRDECLVLTHQIARALGWPSARVHRLDDLLKPFRLADGTRAYDVERALVFIQVLDYGEALFGRREALLARREARARAHRGSRSRA